ncbi:MAG: hypothetical protein Q7S22_04910 [Candidatus Micrarchaeota archaeon]|nr:hypothetical protein [Candidatus Micrarchaeota archaeon]
MDAETALLAIMDKESLEKLVEEKIDEFHGFLSKEVATKLIAKEKGLLKNEEKIVTIKEIAAGDKNISLVAKITKVFPIIEYESGKRSRKIMINDGATIAIKLWNEDVEIVKRLKVGDEVNIRRAYEKNDELALSYSGEFKLSKSAPFSKISELEDNAIVNLRGTVISNPTIGMRELEFQISDGENSVKCITPIDLEVGKHLTKDDEVIVENAVFSKGAIRLLGESRLLVRKTKGIIAGNVTTMNIVNEVIELIIGEQKVKLNRNEFLSLIKVKVAEDISLEAIASLKKDSLLNTYVRISGLN